MGVYLGTARRWAWLSFGCSVRAGQPMQSTSQQLYAYWDRLRNGRAAPHRVEIDPARISALLPETFIAEHAGARSYRFRLAGTRICEHFGRELQGTDLAELWREADRGAVVSLIDTVLTDAAVGYGRSRGYGPDERRACFEFLFFPLIHIGEAPNRLLGTFTAIEPPFWLGTEPLLHLELIELKLHRPGNGPLLQQAGAEVISLVGRRLGNVTKNRRKARKNSSRTDSQTLN